MRNVWLIERMTSRLKGKRAVEFQFVKKGLKGEH